MFKSCLTIIRPNGRCYYYLYNFCNFYDIFYPFLLIILFIDKEKSLEKNNPNDIITGTVEIRIKKTLLILNLGLIIFKSCLALIRPNGRCYY